MHSAARIPKAPTPDLTISTLFWMAATASPKAPPTMGTAEEARNFTAFPEAASTWALSTVCTESTPENSVTASTSAHLAKL